MSGFQTLAGQLSILAAEDGGGGGVHFPPIEDIVKWPAAFGDGQWYGFNKIGLISLIAMVVPFLLFFFAGRKASLVPGKLQNVIETAIDFVEKQIILPAIGKEGMRYLPMLTAMVFFIWIGNLFEVIPTSHMPANARMANPLMLALTSWVMFIGVGVKHNGLGYFKAALFPPGRAEGALPPGDADRAALDLPHPALLARRATLRQHARRSHPARDLLGAVHHAVAARAR